MATMTKKRTEELEGAQLDWAVGIASGWHAVISSQSNPSVQVWADSRGNRHWRVRDWRPSELWSQGGPIIEREVICLHWRYSSIHNSGAWVCIVPRIDHAETYVGPTPLIAAMRAFVASKLGKKVEVPAHD